MSTATEQSVRGCGTHASLDLAHAGFCTPSFETAISMHARPGTRKSKPEHADERRGKGACGVLPCHSCKLMRPETLKPKLDLALAGTEPAHADGHSCGGAALKHVARGDGAQGLSDVACAGPEPARADGCGCGGACGAASARGGGQRRGDERAVAPDQPGAPPRLLLYFTVAHPQQDSRKASISSGRTRKRLQGRLHAKEARPVLSWPHPWLPANLARPGVSCSSSPLHSRGMTLAQKALLQSGRTGSALKGVGNARRRLAA